MKYSRASFPQRLLHFLSSSRGMRFLFWTIVVLHTLRSIFLFSTPGTLIDDNPIFNDDYSYHFYYSLVGSRFLTNHYTSWGYDPYFMAGYPKTIMSDPSNNILEVLCALLPLISPAVILKITVLLTIVLVPIIVYYALKNMAFSRGQCILGALLGTWYWWSGVPYQGTLCGLSFFIFASYVCLFICSAFYRFFQRREFKIVLTLTLIVPLAFLLHPLTPVILIVPLLVMYVWSWKKLDIANHLILIMIFILTITINSFWLMPFVKFYHYKTTSSQFLQSSGMSGFIESYFTTNQGIELLLLVFGLLGLYLWNYRNDPLQYLPLAGGVAFLLFISYGGSVFTFITDLQPQRFIIPFNVFLVVPATCGIAWLTKSIRDTRTKKKWLKAISLCSIVVMLFIAGRRNTIAFTFPARPSESPLSTSLHPANKALIRWISEKTTKSGRILIEDSGFFDTQGRDRNPWGHQFFLAHFPALIPYYTSRELIGGPYPYSIIKHHFAEFHDGMLFKRAIDTFTLPELQSYFDLYNIKWIICWSDRSRTVFNRFPQHLQPNEQVDKFYTYTVKRTPSYFYKGKGQIIADYNKLQLTEVAPDGEIIIKYHWLEQLRTDPPRPLERVMLLDDPVGFIKINDPPSSIVVYNGY